MSHPKSAEEIKVKQRHAAAVETARAGLLKGLPVGEKLEKAEMTALRERYSRFVTGKDGEGFITSDVHEIHRSATPRPYLHALNNLSLNGAAYGSLWDQTGAGYSFHKIVRGGEITKNSEPYKPLLPGKNDRRSFVIREAVSGGEFTALSGEHCDVWPLFPDSPESEGHYQNILCRQWPTRTSIAAQRNQLSSELTALVPKGASCEVWKVTLSNLSPKKRVFDLFARVDWALKSYPVSRLSRTESHELQALPAQNMVLVRNIDVENRNAVAGFFAVDQKWAGFEFSAHSFESALVDGVLSSNPALPVGEDVISALHFKLTLSPKESKTFFFLLGAASGDFEKAKREVDGLRKKYASVKLFDAAAQLCEKAWNELAGKVAVKTPDAEFDRFSNVWSTQQLLNAALFLSGGPKVEFREKMVTLWALVPHLPAEVKEGLRTTICYQLRDGRALSRFSTFSGVPSDEEVTMDNTLWMVLAVCRYVNETGDFAFLDENIGFFDPKLQVIDNTKQAKVYDHIIAAVKCLFDYRGRFGLCKVGSADRNKALTKISKLGGISAWLSMALIVAARELFPYARQRNIKRDVGYLNTILENMYSNLNNYSWNGEFYTYAYDDDGNPIGNRGDKDGAIHLHSNVWAILSGTADQGGKYKAILTALEKLNTPLGYKMVGPAYRLGFNAKGGIPDLIPGIFENGSIDALGRGYVAYTFADRGEGRRAYEAIKSGLPSATLPDISTANPNQVSEFVVGPDHPQFGRAMYDVFNPAVAWIKLAMERMMGIVPVYEGLFISPSVPPEWEEFSVRKSYRQRLLSFRFHNPQKKEKGVQKVTVNGANLAPTEDGRFILEVEKFKATPGKPVYVDVLMG